MNRRYLLLLLPPAVAAGWFVAPMAIPTPELPLQIALAAGCGLLVALVALWPGRRSHHHEAAQDSPDASAQTTEEATGQDAPTDETTSESQPLPQDALELSSFFGDAPDAPADPAERTAAGPSIFDDLPEAEVAATDYQPSYRSLLISLGDIDPAFASAAATPGLSSPEDSPEVPRLRPSPMSRAAATVTAAPRTGPATSPASRPQGPSPQPASPNATGRALDAVAAISPFGVGTSTGVPGELRIENTEHDSVADLASAFESDLDRSAVTAPTSAGRAQGSSSNGQGREDSFNRPILTSRNAMRSSGTDSTAPMLTPRKGMPEELINLTRGPRMFEEAPRHGVESREELEALYNDFIAAFRRAGKQAPLIDYPSFEQRVRDQHVRLLREDPRARIEVSIRQDEGRPRICFRKVS